MRAIKDGVSDGDFAVGDADKASPSGSKPPGTQPSPPAIKEVRSPGRTIKCPGTQASPPAVRDLTACAV